MNQTGKVTLGVVGGISILLLLDKLFSSKPKASSAIGGISSTNVDFQPISYNRRHDETTVKRSISQRLNWVIRNYRSFKIGKSGAPYQRAASYQDFKKMIVLCESRNPHFISQLEKYYLSKLLGTRKNKNLNGGSAGTMKSRNGKYYLYVVVE